MSVPLYMDVHVPAAITRALLLRGVDVLTAQLDGTTRLGDSELLDRATKLGRVLFSQDVDLLKEARGANATAHSLQESFTPIKLESPLAWRFKICRFLAEIGNAQDFASRVEYLPL